MFIPSLLIAEANSRQSIASVLDREKIGDVDMRRLDRQNDPTVYLEMTAKLDDGDRFPAPPGRRRESDRDSAALENMQLGNTGGRAGRKRDRDFAGAGATRLDRRLPRWSKREFAPGRDHDGLLEPVLDPEHRFRTRGLGRRYSRWKAEKH
ncbi:hypothetical protein [Bradyrhizobium embrapense]|uniref:hypothetical protein n=1 Tax=Bradyrhizobium embrapense TaxID=630921 RepID=UPI00156037A3|nr:hypothetical protein [Bradyrhizobium embrapense]